MFAPAKWFLILRLTFLGLGLLTAQAAVLPRSPCPHVFTYNTSNLHSNRWYGEILVRADTTLSGFWIDVELDKPAQLLGNYLAEITSTDNQAYKIQDLDRRLVRGSVTPVQIYVKYSALEQQAPKVRTIRLNGRQICPAEGEHNDPEGLRESSEYDRNVQPQRGGTQHRGSQTQTSNNNNRPIFHTTATQPTRRNPVSSEQGKTVHRVQTTVFDDIGKAGIRSSGPDDFPNISDLLNGQDPSAAGFDRGTQTIEETVSEDGTRRRITITGHKRVVHEETQTHDFPFDNRTNVNQGYEPQRGNAGNVPKRTQHVSSFQGSPQRGSDPYRGGDTSRRSTTEQPSRVEFASSVGSGSIEEIITISEIRPGPLPEPQPPRRPVAATTERYRPDPITPHPNRNVRPGLTPLSNSNVRPTEASSSDYYEWGIRRTTERSRVRTSTQRTSDYQSSSSNSNAECGKVSIRPVALISRGTPTRSGDYPWHAAIYRPEGIDLRYICGATLISLNTLVTAAHCVTRQSNGLPVKPDSLVIYLGKHSLRRWTGNEQTATVSEVIVHPEYNHTAFQADLALLKLSVPVTYNDYVRPVCLWDSRRSSIESVVARRGTVVGWGYDEYQVVTDELMQAQMPVVTKLECIQSYPTFFSRFVSDMTYCAGFRNGTTACNGDSGGGMVFLEEPLNFNENESLWRIRGVVSIGVSITDKFVCDYNHYIVFTDLAQFLPWLEANM